MKAPAALSVGRREGIACLTKGQEGVAGFAAKRQPDFSRWTSAAIPEIAAI